MAEIEYAAAEATISERVANTLHQAYPGHAWAAKADIWAGTVAIYNFHLSGKWGFLMKLSDLVGDVNMKKVIAAGGELLERYRMSRGRFNQDQYESLETDAVGNFRADRG